MNSRKAAERDRDADHQAEGLVERVVDRQVEAGQHHHGQQATATHLALFQGRPAGTRL